MSGLHVAIVPARSGSKRLPGKNSRLLAGKPLIVWTLEAALASEQFDEILVTTDCTTLASISLSAGASVPFLRPAELSSDTATTNDVVRHAVGWIEQHQGTVSRVALLQPTSPLRTAQDITQALALYEAKRASAVVSVCPTDHPLQFCNTLPASLSMANFIQREDLQRSQDLPISWRLNGAIYILDRRYVGDLSAIYSENTFAYTMEKERSVDIDNELDFMLAELLLSRSVAPQR
ncbi:TPA: acylneuraminate cytidylyltransferase family protein [Citrobacter sedlakii]|nr:acylneuraminate cytidylyltransferase family protein [Citrobacter sedlakii]HCA7081554.1 acylneuraminate cytidylyltransferase family protein [Citrobacter sedlakii]HCA7134876.1 acylneuraminate cytidylyltransferase family protein [Citrobacter sedlakii]HCA7138131.1 acylneuraminate cytidylyltransferase family protein [Citrobacter sedlakii]HCA7180844.1 acylneuraminate cytidylyltransferase family protein [Citrobacter sedlakii]